MSCETCKSIAVCLQFPVVFYDLNNGRTYRNGASQFTVTCPDSTTHTVVIPEGQVVFTWPYPVGFSGTYPPLILVCPAGGTLTQHVPSGATQTQIDAIINNLIYQCAQAVAVATVTCATGFPSNQVIYQSTCTGPAKLTYTGTLPSWITLNDVTNQLIGYPGAFVSQVSVADATAQAQAALDAFAAAALLAGTLTCVSITCVAKTGTLALNRASVMVISDDAAQRMLIINDFNVVSYFVRTDTNATISTPGVTIGQPNACYVSSSQRFFVQAANINPDCFDVYDLTGTKIAATASPLNLYPGCVVSYEATADKVYFAQTNAGTVWIVATNPTTYAVTNTNTTLAPSDPFTTAKPVLSLPGKIIVDFGGPFTSNGVLHFFSSPALAHLGSLDITGLHGGWAVTLNGQGYMSYAYAASTGKIYFGMNDGALLEVDPTTMLVTHDYGVISPNAQGLQSLFYNTTSGALLATDYFGEIIVVNPVARTIICSVPDDNPPDFFSNIVSDPVTGDDYKGDSSNNTVETYH